MAFSQPFRGTFPGIELETLVATHIFHESLFANAENSSSNNNNNSSDERPSLLWIGGTVEGELILFANEGTNMRVVVRNKQWGGTGASNSPILQIVPIQREGVALILHDATVSIVNIATLTPFEVQCEKRKAASLGADSGSNRFVVAHGKKLYYYRVGTSHPLREMKLNYSEPKGPIVLHGALAIVATKKGYVFVDFNSSREAEVAKVPLSPFLLSLTADEIMFSTEGGGCFVSLTGGTIGDGGGSKREEGGALLSKKSGGGGGVEDSVQGFGGAPSPPFYFTTTPAVPHLSQSFASSPAAAIPSSLVSGGLTPRGGGGGTASSVASSSSATSSSVAIPGSSALPPSPPLSQSVPNFSPATLGPSSSPFSTTPSSSPYLSSAPTPASSSLNRTVCATRDSWGWRSKDSSGGPAPQLVSAVYYHPLIVVLFKGPSRIEVFDVLKKAVVQTMPVEEDVTILTGLKGVIIAASRLSFWMLHCPSSSHISSRLTDFQSQGEGLVKFEEKWQKLKSTKGCEKLVALGEENISVFGVAREESEHMDVALERAVDDRLPLHVRECLRSFSTDWICVARSSLLKLKSMRQNSELAIMESDIVLEEEDELLSPPPPPPAPLRREEEEEEDVVDEKENSEGKVEEGKEEDFVVRRKTSPFLMPLSLHENYSEKVERRNAENRSKNRPSVFALRPDIFPPLHLEQRVRTHLPPPVASPYQSFPSCALHLSINSFSLPAFEKVLEQPYFCTVSLYSEAKRVRIAEDVHFQTNGTRFEGLEIGQPLTIKFSPLPPSLRLLVVIRVDSIFHGDVKTTNANLAESAIKEKKAQEYRKRTADTLAVMHRYRQNVAWAFARVPQAEVSLSGGADASSLYRLNNTPLTDAFLFSTLEKIDDRKLIKGGFFITYTFVKPKPPSAVNLVPIAPNDGEMKSDDSSGASAFSVTNALSSQAISSLLPSKTSEKKKSHNQILPPLGTSFSASSSFFTPTFASPLGEIAARKTTVGGGGAANIFGDRSKDTAELSERGVSGRRHSFMVDARRQKPKEGGGEKEVSSSRPSPECILESRSFLKSLFGNIPPHPNLSLEHMLYVYPVCANISHLRKSAGHNISLKFQVKKKDAHGEALPLIIGPKGEMLTEVFTSSSYHNTTPNYSMEIKIALPLFLTEEHHLLITVCHVGCRNSATKRKKPLVEKIVGHCFLPIMAKGSESVITDGLHSLPIFTKLNPNYLSGARGKGGSNNGHGHSNHNNNNNNSGNSAGQHHNHGNENMSIQGGGGGVGNDNNISNNASGASNVGFGWIEGENDGLHIDIETRIVSSIFPQDVRLGTVLSLLSNRGGGGLSEEQIEKILARLINCDVGELFAMIFPVLSLIFLLLDRESERIQQSAFCALVTVIGRLCHTLSAEQSFSFFSDYIIFSFSFLNYEALVKSFLVTLSPSSEPAVPKMCKAYALDHADLLFAMIFKSVSLFLHKNRRSLEIPSDPPLHTLFPPSFFDNLRDLFAHLALEVRFVSMSPLAQKLNRSCAIFLSDLFAVGDKGKLSLIAFDYLSLLDSGHSDAATANLKLSFLKILSEHEHYLPLHLPLFLERDTIPTLLRSEPPLLFFCHVLMNQIISALHSPPAFSGAVNIFLDRLRRDLSPPLPAPVTPPSISSLYLPLVFSVMKMRRTISELPAASQSTLLLILVIILKNSEKSDILSLWKAVRQSDGVSRILDIFQIMVNQIGVGALVEEAGLTTLECIELLKETLLETHITNDMLQAKGDMLSLSLHSTPSSPLSDFTTLTEIFNFMLFLLDRSLSPRLFDAVVESLASMVGAFPVLFFSPSSSYSRSLCFHLFKLCTFVPENTHSKSAAALLYLLIRRNFAYCGNFTTMKVGATTALSSVLSESCNSDETIRPVFQMCLEFCEKDDLDFQICPSSMPKKDRKSIATSDIHLSPMRVPSIPQTAEYLEKYRGEVSELVKLLNSVVSDSLQVVKERNLGGNVEILAQLYSDVARGYKHAPQLRMTWLEALVQLHLSTESYVEAAYTLLEMCCQITAYLLHFDSSFNQSSSLSTSNNPSPLFRPVSPAASSLPHPSLSAASQIDASIILMTRNHLPSFFSLCDKIAGVRKFDLDFDNPSLSDILRQSHLFSPIFVVNALQHAVKLLDQGGYFYVCKEIYEVLIQYFHDHEEWGKMSECYAHLADLFQRIENTGGGGAGGSNNALAMYYRIKYYGQAFGDEHNKEYVFRENRFVRIADFVDKHEMLWKKRLGPENVKIVPQFNQDLNSFDSSKNYLQINAVEPLVEDVLSHNSLPFPIKECRISDFVIEIPFTAEGKAYGAIKDQHKRRVIFTVESCFPNIVKKLPIVSTRTVVLNPIENSIDSIKKKVAELRSHLLAKEPDVKALQGVLQGSVKAMVNFGPSEICKAFLANACLTEGDRFDKGVLELAQTMELFLDYAHKAVKLNHKLTDLSDANQRAFHALLEGGLQEVVNEIGPHIERVMKAAETPILKEC